MRSIGSPSRSSLNWSVGLLYLGLNRRQCSSLMIQTRYSCPCRANHHHHRFELLGHQKNCLFPLSYCFDRDSTCLWGRDPWDLKPRFAHCSAWMFSTMVGKSPSTAHFGSYCSQLRQAEKCVGSCLLDLQSYQSLSQDDAPSNRNSHLTPLAQRSRPISHRRWHPYGFSCEWCQGQVSFLGGT